MNTKVRDIWTNAQKLLINSLSLETNEARIEAQLLLQTVVHVDRAWLITHANDTLESSGINAFIYENFNALLNRRLTGEPIAYIIGYREFFGLDFIVSPDTLIPRPDTELLVETALDKVMNHSDFSVLDLGTGTGAVAIAIAYHRSQCQLTAVDASIAALEIAARNADHLKTTNIQFVQSDWFSNLKDNQFNIIVSNPPYIPQNDDHLVQGDLRFEPISALAAGLDGLDDIRHIIDHCLIYLKPQGWLMLEHGFNQANYVTDLMAGAGLVEITTLKDLGNNDRITIAKNPLIVSTHWD